MALRSGGIGPFDFGTASSSAVIDAIVVGLGAPISNDLTLYPDADPVNGVYYTADGSAYLDNPVGRTTCWGHNFCVDFSGAADASLHMIGWWYSGPRRLIFSTASLTIGDTWSDFPHMDVYPGCYEGQGSHQGIFVRLQTDDPWQWTVDDAGIVPHLPDPTIAKVIWMSAGEGPVGTEGADC